VGVNVCAAPAAAADLLRDTDTAMYAAKRQGKARSAPSNRAYASRRPIA
jgi:GGDEF domain-containing protein